MAKFIHILNQNEIINTSKTSAWKITKVNGEVVYITASSPFETLFQNGYISITDIFNRNILLNNNHCIDMIQITLTITETKYKGVQFFEGDYEIVSGYCNSNDVAIPITINEKKNICG